MGRRSAVEKLSVNDPEYLRQAAEMGRRLKKQRELRKLSQGQLSRASGVSTGAIGNYEQGTRRIDRDYCVIFAEFFGLPAGYFTLDLTEEEAMIIAAMRAASRKKVPT